MRERFRRGEDAPEAGARSAATSTTETRVADDERESASDEHAPRFAKDAPATAGTTGMTAGTLRDVRARQRDEYGGINWGAAFFGFLSAAGLAAILAGLVSAAGATLSLTTGVENDAAGNEETIGIVGGILFLVLLGVAYFAGGYVAGRMSRFDGARQGLGVWSVALIVTVVLAVAGALLGGEYNVLEQLNLPNIPVDNGDVATGGLIALGLAVLVTLISAMAGGKAGERYHRKIDRVGIDHLS